MSKRLLLPHKFKKVGWFILMAAIIAGIWRSFSDYEVDWLQWKVFSFYSKEIFQDSAAFSWRPVNVTNTLIGVLFIIGSVLVGFSKEKEEDEFIRELRLSSLLWAVLISYALLLLAFLTIYGFAFFSVMVYNMFTVLVIFIIRFHYLLYKNAKGLPNEK
jgi:predicted MFS family arabinose efflux permease